MKGEKRGIEIARYPWNPLRRGPLVDRRSRLKSSQAVLSGTECVDRDWILYSIRLLGKLIVPSVSQFLRKLLEIINSCVKYLLYEKIELFEKFVKKFKQH